MNKDHVVELCRAYANTTGIPVTVLDAGIKSENAQAEPPWPGEFCRCIQSLYGRSEICRQAHLYGSYQAERFGDFYVFFCPFGLVHWAAPVLKEGTLAYGLVAGPVLMSTPDDALIGEILAHNGLGQAEIGLLRAKVATVIYAAPARVQDLGRMLFAVAASLTAGETALAERRVIQAQQASIGQVLQDLKKTDGDGAYPLALEKELILKIRLGDKPGAQELLNRLFGYLFFQRGNDLESIKIRLIELVVLLSRGAIEGGADNEVIFGLNYRFLREIESLRSVDEIAAWLAKVMARFTDCVFNLSNVKNKDVIYKAVAYLRGNYMRPISLADAAREVHLSPSYFSRIFKEEMGRNFRAYLNGLRVENSRSLLADESVPLAEVAGMAGFQDQSYFTKVFKRLTGVSPGEYRRTRGTGRLRRELLDNGSVAANLRDSARGAGQGGAGSGRGGAG